MNKIHSWLNLINHNLLFLIIELFPQEIIMYSISIWMILHGQDIFYLSELLIGQFQLSILLII